MFGFDLLQVKSFQWVTSEKHSLWALNGSLRCSEAQINAYEETFLEWRHLLSSLAAVQDQNRLSWGMKEKTRTAARKTGIWILENGGREEECRNWGALWGHDRRLNMQQMLQAHAWWGVMACLEQCHGNAALIVHRIFDASTPEKKNHPKYLHPSAYRLPWRKRRQSNYSFCQHPASAEHLYWTLLKLKLSYANRSRVPVKTQTQQTSS